MNPVKCKAVFNIRRNGKKIEAGTEFECDDQGLIDCGAAIPLDQLKASDEGSEGASTGADGDPSGGASGNPSDLSELFAAWLERDPKQKDDTLWTKDKKPRNKRVDSELDRNVTGDELTAAWEAFKAEQDA